MATLTGTPYPGSKLSSAINIAVVALGAPVAVSVAVLFLSLTGPSRTRTTPRHQSPRYAPLIHYYSTGGTTNGNSHTPDASQRAERPGHG